MSEDVAESMILGVTIVLMVTTVAAVIVVAVLGNKILGDFVQKYTTAVSGGYSESFLSLGDVQDVSATVAYKAIEERIDEIESLNIIYLNGITTTDHETLLENAEKLVTMDVEMTARGTYLVSVVEVKY